MMFNFRAIPYKRSGRAGGLGVFATGVSAFVLVAALFLASCTDEDTVEVPGPTVTTPGPTVTTTVEVPADITGTDGDDDLSHLTGSAVDDTIDGKGGDDMMQGGDGDDELMGGAGNDEISGGFLTLKKEEDATDNQGNAIKKSVTVTGCARGKDMRIDGDDGDDTITGGAGDDSLYGGSGDDTIYGEGGDDTICGNNDDDALYGGDGDDTLDGGLGDDDIDGGDGEDLVDYSLVAHPNNPIAGIEVNLAKGGTVRDGAYGRDTLTGIEKIKGNSLDDKFTGDDGDNTFMPGAGADTVDGGAGSDTLDYSDAYNPNDTSDPPAAAGGIISLAIASCTDSGDASNPATETIITVGGADNTAVNDKIRAPHGKDKNGAVTCFSSIENLVGGAGSNTLTGDAQANMLTGGAAGDSITGGAGNDTIKGMGGPDDPLSGGAGNDVIYGGHAYAYDKEIHTVDGDDTLNGGAGNDMLHGEAGDNSYTGGAGDDTYYVTDPADVTSQGAIGITESAEGGTDTVSLAMYAPATEPTGTTAVFSVDLGQDSSGAHIENLVGSKYRDSLTGNSEANEIDGGAGNDTIDGGAGNDMLDGGPGNDTLTGGDGNDIFVIRSGEGNDTLGSSGDQVANTDKIQFKGFGAGTAASYRSTTAGFLITIGNQSLEVLTDLTETNLKKIVTVQ